MKKSKAVFAALALAGLVSANAHAQATTSTAQSINMTEPCAGVVVGAANGTRTVTGSYDLTTGALNTTTKLTACIARNGDKFDGSTVTTGTLKATPTGFDINLTASVNTTILRSDLSTVVRVCTSTKIGTFTTANQTFDGVTSQTNCSVTGKVLEHEDLVEHLLRPALGDEDGGGKEATKRVRAPRSTDDSIPEQHDVSGGGGSGSGRDPARPGV